MVEDARSKIAARSIGKIMTDLAWENRDFTKSLIVDLLQNVQDKDYVKSKPFIRVLKHIVLMRDSMFDERVIACVVFGDAYVSCCV
jgi:hypothetical protein